MKTIKDISDETGVSVQTVYRRLNKLSQSSNESLTEKVNGIAYFTETGEKLILETLSTVKQSLNADKQSESDNVLFLREQIKILNEQIERLTKMNENSQILLLNQQSLLPPKVSLWKKLFKRND